MSEAPRGPGDDAPPRVDQTVLDDLRARLRGFRRIPLTGDVGWDRGADPAFLAGLIASWAEDYDWRPHEDRIRSLPWARAGRARVVHQRAADPAAPAVVLLHGWPDSVLRFDRVLPLLTDVHVVVPALPGYPFAEAVAESGMSSAEMADVVAGALASLGYVRAVVSGGDIGSSVATALATLHPERVAALHLTDLLGVAPPSDRGSQSDEEREYRARARRWRLAEGAYLLEQATKPHTLAVGLGDSPAGLAAWIVEKLRGWSDCGGDVETVFPREELLTWVTAYWVTGTIGSSFGPYTRPSPPVERVAVPTVVSRFPHELVPAPRSVAERGLDLRGWREHDSGGHFAAWERPEEFVGGLRAALELL